MGNKPCSSNLLLKCKNSGDTFLIDSGATISVVPLSFASRPAFVKKAGVSLKAANGTAIRTTGSWHHNLSLPNLPQHTWTFVVADVATPIIGADLLRDWGLVVDFANNSVTQSSRQAEWQQVNNITIDKTPPAVVQLLQEYKDVFATSLEGLPPVPSKIDQLDVSHHIVTQGPPLHCMPRRLGPEREQALA